MLPARIDAKIDRSGDCWLWMGARDPRGYGRVYRGPGLTTGWAHRVVHEYLVGPIDSAIHLDHSCPNKACVRPEHVRRVSQADNNRLIFVRQRTCKRGHERTPENTRVVTRRSGVVENWCLACTKQRESMR